MTQPSNATPPDTTTSATEAPEVPQPEPAATPTAETKPTPDTAPDDTPDEADHGDIGKARKDAAKYRARLRETETERDQLRDQLAGQHRALIDWRASTTVGGVDPALLDAAGVNVADLLDDTGHLNMSAVDQFIDATAKRFNIARGFTPNRAQGQSGNASPPQKQSLASAFKPT